MAILKRYKCIKLNDEYLRLATTLEDAEYLINEFIERVNK